MKLGKCVCKSHNVKLLSITEMWDFIDDFDIDDPEIEPTGNFSCVIVCEDCKRVRHVVVSSDGHREEMLDIVDKHKAQAKLSSFLEGVKRSRKQ